MLWGLGPDSGLCSRLCPAATRVFWIEAPDFEAQMSPQWRADIPPAWTRVDPERGLDLSRTTRTLTYTPNARLFPSFWQPLAARLRTTRTSPRTKTIWLPGPDHALVAPELARAALGLGFSPRRLPSILDATDLIHHLERETPALFLSVNFHGLDPHGENQALLEAAGVPIVAWCVDNPFHVLSFQKNQLWKRLILAVTDDWFVPLLRELGARPVHLPLATDPEVFAPSAICPHGRDLLFVGRSRFPDRDAFFAASAVPEALLQAAHRLPGRRAHFGWWREQLGGPLWPGQTVRNMGLGAELASAAWRVENLRALAQTEDLTIVGDTAWAGLVPAARLHPPVDYYAGLARAYRQASFCLNLTSLLLPHGLTQRHFDVWAGGGFLLTDATPGLDIFPPELTRAVRFDSPAQARALLRDLAAHPDRKDDLRRAWQEHILTAHTYANRLEQILTECRIAAA